MNSTVAVESRGEALLADDGRVWLYFDVNNAGAEAARFTHLSSQVSVLNAHHEPFRLDYNGLSRVLIINGMGVALGDSVIGLSALHWLRRTYPHLQITLWRSFTTPDYVEALYGLADPAIRVERLPQPFGRFAEFDAVIDLAEFVFRPAFDRLPMVDFFLESLGIDPASVERKDKANHWLMQQFRPWPAPRHDEPYVLFCPVSSAELRCIPAEMHAPMIDALWERYRLPVVGFSPIAHPRFQDASSQSRHLPDFLQLIGNAAHVVSTDSAAIHLAAGLDKETTAYFVSIRPELRTRDYPRCRSIHLDREGVLDGLHTSDSPRHLAYARECWQAALAA